MNEKFSDKRKSSISNNAWKEYSERTKDNSPRPLLVEALLLVKNRGTALDLGPGALNDSRYLLNEGFKKVVAVDIEPIAQERADSLPRNEFEYVISSFESYDFKENTFDLINAQYSLPFISPESFADLFQKICAALKSGGIFTGQLFGERDE